MNEQGLRATARALVAGDKGLLAMDESNGTCNKRFAKAGIPADRGGPARLSGIDCDHAGSGECISGAILYDETIRQTTTDGTPFVKVLIDAGIMPGIKVDIGAKAARRPSRRDGSPKAWTDCVTASRSTARWVPVSPSGAR